MIQVFTLEEDLGATQMLTEAFGMIDRRGTTDIMLKVTIQFSKELGILHVAFIRKAELLNGLHQGFSNKNAAIRPKMAARIRIVVHLGSACFDSQILVPL